METCLVCKTELDNDDRELCNYCISDGYMEPVDAPEPDYDTYVKEVRAGLHA